MDKSRVLVSACLLGEPVRYDGGDVPARRSVFEQWRKEGRLVSICPEVAGGLPVPRPPAEIAGGDGQHVLNGAAAVREDDGRNVTEAFIRGAEKTLDLAIRENVRVAVLTHRSPSCGSDGVYDGGFSGTVRAGSGVTAALLERHGVRVFTQHQLDEALECLAALDAER